MTSAPLMWSDSWVDEETKACACGNTKLLARGRCKTCYHRDRRACGHKENPETVSSRNKRYQAANGESLRLRSSVYYRDNREKVLASQAEYSKANKAKIASRCRRWYSGFTDELVDRLRVSQGGKCAICNVVMDTVNKRSVTGEHCDHDHATGKPRGLLCKTCNTSLGSFEKLRGLAEDYLDNPPVSKLDL